MEYKNFPTEVTEIDDRTVTSLYSVAGHVDAANDRVMLGAFTKTLAERMERVKVLWQHDLEAPPIGVPVMVKEVLREELPGTFLAKFPDATGGLLGKVRFIDTPRGNEVLTGIREGAITENSIGFDSIKFDYDSASDGERGIRNLRECRLWDISPVNWGMNDAARVLIKSAVPFKDTGTTDEGKEWDAPTLSDFTEKSWDELDETERRRIAAHYAWASETLPENFSDLKLPHHEPSKSGVGPAVWHGVSSAMGALMGARGGTDIPDTDRKSVYEHLKKHYVQYEKDAPEFKVVEFVSLIGLFRADELKVGRVLSEKNYGRIKNAISELADVLLEAEPQTEDTPKGIVLPSALTSARRLRLEIAIRERERGI